MPNVIAGLGEKTDFVAAVPNVDADRLNLTPDERALFDRVGRAAQIFQLVAGAPHPEAKTIGLLLSLRAKGAIVPARVQRAQSQGGSMPAAGMQEAVDLSEEKKREILDFEIAIETKNHFELFGLKPTATATEVRDAFYELSRKFHPDRFFKRNIGSFRARIEVAFRKLSQAHEVLTDDVKRAAYVKAHPELASAVQKAEPARPAAAPSADDRARAAERAARFSRHPYFATGKRTNELVARAKEHIAKGDYGHAFTDLHMAHQIDAASEEVKRLLNEVRAKNDVARAESELKRGLDVLEQGNEIGALAAFKTAVNIDSRNAKAAFMVAKMMWDRSAEPKDVQPYAQKAADAEPKNPDYHVLLGRVLDAMGSKALAKKHFEEALKLDPKNAEAKKHVKGRWPF